ncbi:MAG: hypothetical protein FWG66_12995 [Spirochaetes bacterium]|nr:hypothetical protein [Spirochaetota bacterium]
MENQNSTEQMEKKGFSQSLRRNKTKIAAVCVAVLLISSCAHRAASWGAPAAAGKAFFLTGGGGSSVAAMEFEPLGLVFAEADGSRRNGFGAAHEALVREAAALGADGIINVNIFPTNRRFLNVTWSGSALAIRYQQ